MPTKPKERRIARLALAFALLLMVCSAFFLTPAHPVKADDPGDNYPWSGATNVGFSEWGYSTCPSNDSNCMVLNDTLKGVTYGTADPWGYNLRNCTSWAAWAVHDRDGVDVPHGLGNAKDWATNASSDHITVNTTPANGAVAQWNSANWNYTYGHVAWVETVNSSTSITIEEYNVQIDGNGNPTGQWSSATLTQGSSKPMPWPDNFIHFKDLSGTSTATSTSPSTTILALKSTRSPNGAIETFAATNSRVTEDWYYNGGNGPQTRAIIDIAQNNIVSVDKLNIDSTELLYTAVSDGVWESAWAADSGTVTSSKPVTGLTGVRSVFAENTFDGTGYRIHHLYILANDGPYEAYWKDSDPTHTVHVGRLTQINGGIAMAHSIGPDGSEQLYVAVPTWVYEVSWFPSGTITVRPVINIAQGDIRSVEKGANLPDGGQPLYTTTSTTVWQTYWNGSSGFSNGTIATNQINAFQSLKLVTSDGKHHVYLATPDHVQEYWWPPAFGGGEIIRISQANITAIAQQLDGTTQLLLTAAGNNVWETWWDSSHAPTTPASPLFSVAK